MENALMNTTLLRTKQDKETNVTVGSSFMRRMLVYTGCIFSLMIDIL